MKKIAVTVAMLCAMFVVMGCGSSQPAAAPAPEVQGGSYPAFIRETRRNAPEDVLVGIGSANLASDAQARTISETRARAEISRQMNSMIEDMVRDYTAGSELDHSAALSFQENITVALSKSTLVGARIMDQDKVDGTTWTIIYLGKSNVVNEINQAQAAAKLAVPAMASFNAEDRMNEAFARNRDSNF